MTAETEYVYDPMDQGQAKDLDLLAKIREEEGVVRTTGGMVLSTRYADTAKAFRDNKRLSSKGDMRAPGVVVPVEESFLGEIDPPLHPKIRRILIRGFTPQAAMDSEDWTRDHVRRRLAEVDAKGGGDLMDTLAIPLPGSISAHVLGIPDDQHDQMMSWCNEVLHSSWIPTGETDLGVGIEKSFPAISAAIDALIAERRGKEPTDLLGVMVNTVGDDGWRIPEQLVRTLTINILAGSLSASYLIGNLLYRYLLDVDGFVEEIAADPSKIPAAVAESMRLEAPVQFMFRHASGDLDIGQCPVRSGEHVLLSIAAANRDPDVYPDPDQFRLDRENPTEHLGFGLGPHLCLGNHLTNMVGRIILEEVLARFPKGRLELVPDYEWVCVDHMMEYGPEHLPVTVVGKPTEG